MAKKLQTDVIYHGDNLEVLKTLPENSVDLIYLDPPFFSNKHYEVIWNDGSEIRSFKDRWKGGINHYIGWMEERLFECKRVLKKTGSIYLHCDWHASYYLKVMMDKLFGEKKFQNEIIWAYKRYTAESKRFQRMHDVILFYTKSINYTFNQLLDPYGTKSGPKDTHYKQDEEGRWFRWQKRKGKEPYKVYLSEGVRINDVWNLPHINASSRERLGYPTQKPEALLERIVKASSNKNNIVLDPFCGCGTTIAVAQRLGRKWIGIDVSLNACKLMKDRLNKLGVGKIEIIGAPMSIDNLKKLEPFEFQGWIVRNIHGTVSDRKSTDMGIDGYDLWHNPIQVKQSEKVGRNVVDNFETAIKRFGRDKGEIYAFSFTRGAYEEVARAKKDGVEIKLITIEELLKQNS